MRVTAHLVPTGAWTIALVAAAGGVTWAAAWARRRWTWRATVAAAGVLTAALAVSPPVEHAAEHGVAPHMAQHLLLVSVAAPLSTLAPRPAPAALPPALRRLAAVAGRPGRGRSSTVLAVAAVHATVVAAWHVPGPYDAATRNPAVHAVEHLTLLGTGIALWAAVRATARRSPLACIPALFLAAVVGAGTGALLTFAPHPLYALSSTAPDPLADQQLAGLLMWVPGGLVPAAGAAGVLTHALTDRAGTLGPANAR